MASSHYSRRLATAVLASFASLVAGQFQVAPTGSFAGLGLTTTCENILYQNINCNPFVLSLGQKVYHGSPGDKTFTETVCSATCSSALQNAQRRITGACAQTPELFPGFPVTALIDPIISGWNETCLKDSDGAYCNGEPPPKKTLSRSNSTISLTRTAKNSQDRSVPASRKH